MTRYDKPTVVAIAATAREITRDAVAMSDPANPGDGLRYLDMHCVKVWNTARSRTAGREAAAYYAGAALWWTAYVLRDGDILTGPLLAASVLHTEAAPQRVRENFREGRERAMSVYEQRLRDLRRTGRYSIDPEFTGTPDGPHWVVKFDGAVVTRITPADVPVDHPRTLPEFRTAEADPQKRAVAEAWRRAYLHHVEHTTPTDTDQADTDQTSGEGRSPGPSAPPTH